jgi:hypothetical protein
VRVGILGPISAAYAILSFHYTRDLAQGLGGSRVKSRDADLPKDTVGREARPCGHVRIEREIGVPPIGSWKSRGQKPSRFASSNEGEMEWVVTLSPLSPPRMTLFLPWDAAPHRQVHG